MKTMFTKTASKITLGLTTMLIAILALSATTSADECDHIDSLARKIQRKTRLLVKETVHYRHTHQYRSLVRETSSLYGAATHIHEVVHFEDNLHHLEADLAQMDRCFHRLESLFDATEAQASHGHGKISGNTRHVKVLLNSIEDCIHHIQDDVRALRLRHQRVRRPVYIPTPPTYRPVYSGYRPTPTYRPANPGCGYGSRNQGLSFSIGGGSSRIHFGF